VAFDRKNVVIFFRRVKKLSNDGKGFCIASWKVFMKIAAQLCPGIGHSILYLIKIYQLLIGFRQQLADVLGNVRKIGVGFDRFGH